MTRPHELDDLTDLECLDTEGGDGWKVILDPDYEPCPCPWPPPSPETI